LSSINRAAATEGGNLVNQTQTASQQDFTPAAQNPGIKTIQTRFGDVDYSPANVLQFPEGLLGFGELREFIVMPNQKHGPLFWIQSVDDPQVAFVLTDPTNFFPEYQVVPDSSERKKLGMRKADEAHVLSVVTIHPDLNITLNLQAPVLLAAHSNRALQVILEKTSYSTREPLPPVK